MTRSKPAQRIEAVAQAVTNAFGKLGYQRTHMADVARAAGLSAGAIYSYVESKEALFHVVVAHGFGLLAEGTSLPMATPSFSDTLDLIGQGLRKSGGTPALRIALKDDDPPDVRAELTAVIEERYTMTERLWPVLAVIERSAVDLPARPMTSSNRLSRREACRAEDSCRASTRRE